jgi:hypothetical protein
MRKQGVVAEAKPRKRLAAFQELVKRLTRAKSFEEALRIQTAFMHSQLNRMTGQATSFGIASATAAENANKK